MKYSSRFEQRQHDRARMPSPLIHCMLLATWNDLTAYSGSLPQREPDSGLFSRIGRMACVLR
jgi:hypothetical protein